jgi:hypothetical protein
LILPDSGTAGPGSFLDSSHTPYFIGATQFFFTVPGATTAANLVTADFSNVTIGFGTGSDPTLGTTQTGTGGSIQDVVPDPSSLAIAAFGTLGFHAYGLRRRLNEPRFRKTTSGYFGTELSLVPLTRRIRGG